MPDLTVVVPIYNVENYLNKCVMSILGQTYVPKKSYWLMMVQLTKAEK